MKIDHITLMVSSFELGMPYYDRLLPLLGFSKQRDHVWSNEEGFSFQFLQAKPGPPRYERYGPGMNHLGFGASSVEQVQSIRSSMIAAGFEAPEIQNLDGAMALFMKDPDGVRFEITWYPPGMAVVD